MQDFESITPNILARTIETVQGGGLVILLLKGMSSLKQLYTLTMDVHSRYRTEAYDDVVARFNERFILSLGSCESCLVVDDELNVLPISGANKVKALPLPGRDEEEENKTPAQKELDGIKESLRDTQPVGSLVQLARTNDQAKALLTFVDAIAEKTLRNTVTLTAARGRGKSAASTHLAPRLPPRMHANFSLLIIILLQWALPLLLPSHMATATFSSLRLHLKISRRCSSSFSKG